MTSSCVDEREEGPLSSESPKWAATAICGENLTPTLAFHSWTGGKCPIKSGLNSVFVTSLFLHQYVESEMVA